MECAGCLLLWIRLSHRGFQLVIVHVCDIPMRYQPLRRPLRIAVVVVVAVLLLPFYRLSVCQMAEMNQNDHLSYLVLVLLLPLVVLMALVTSVGRQPVKGLLLIEMSHLYFALLHPIHVALLVHYLLRQRFEYNVGQHN